MVYKADKLRLRKLLMDAISLLCKNGLPVQSAFRIEATIGITLSEDEVVLVSFREVVQPDGAMGPQALTEDDASDEEEEASSVLSHGDELDVPDKKHTEDNVAKEGIVHGVETSNEIEDEMGAWSETGNPGFAGNPGGIIGNSHLRRQSSGVENPNCPRFDRNIAPPLNHLGGRRLSIQVKDEVVDEDEDCSFVKMEDGEHFDPLAQDDSWMYQVYNETNLYNAVGEFSQLTQDYEDTPSGGLAPVASNQSWTATPRDVVRPSQPQHRGGSGNTRGGGGGGGMVRSGVRQSLPVASRSQVMVMGLCRRIISESTLESTGGYLCHICQARLGNIQTLRNHIKKTHLAMKIERCRTCGAAFRWASQLARHKKREHGHQGGSQGIGYGEGMMGAAYGGGDEGVRYSAGGTE